MSKLTVNVKTRVTSDIKEKLDLIASHRQLDVSDLVREALREWIPKQIQKSLPHPAQPELVEVGK